MISHYLILWAWQSHLNLWGSVDFWFFFVNSFTRIPHQQELMGTFQDPHNLNLNKLVTYLAAVCLEQIQWRRKWDRGTKESLLKGQLSFSQKKRKKRGGVCRGLETCCASVYWHCVMPLQHPLTWKCSTERDKTIGVRSLLCICCSLNQSLNKLVSANIHSILHTSFRVKNTVRQRFTFCFEKRNAYFLWNTCTGFFCWFKYRRKITIAY